MCIRSEVLLQTVSASGQRDLAASPLIPDSASAQGGRGLSTAFQDLINREGRRYQPYRKFHN